MPASSPILFFDGVCGLCNHFVDWLIQRDHGRVFRYSPLQGATARERLSGVDLRAAEGLETVILVDDKGVHQRSDAVLRVLGHLGGLWGLFGVFFLVPRGLRNWAYDWVARHRYGWFGKHETCRLPSSEERTFFLD